MKKILVPLTVDSGVPNVGGLTLSRMTSASPPTALALTLGIDSAGNIVIKEGFPSATLLSDVSNTGNTSTDVAAVTATIPANSIYAGLNISIDASGTMNNSNAASTFNLWVKLGTTKILTITAATPSAAQTNKGFIFGSILTIRTTGSTGTLMANADLSYVASTATVSSVVCNTATTTINTTISNTISFGFNWTTTNASNVITTRQASIRSI
jgi:hypothetical protein